jgi:hypothetical protein
MLPRAPMKALANRARARKRYCSMPRKRKISEDQGVPPDGAVAGNGSTGLATMKKKGSARRKPAAKKSAPENSQVTRPQISDEAIRLRAYLIAEDRARRGLPGDENSDWLEARRQLIEELG